MNQNFDNEETLPNGINVKRKIRFHPCELDQVNTPWLATINMGGWHYSKGGSTKEMAIASILEYMQDLRKKFEDQLKKDHERLDELKKFLEKNT